MGVWSRLTGFFRGAGKSEARPHQGQAIADQSLWLQFQRIGGGLTPREVSEIIRAADSGDMSRLVDLANEARQKDGHLQSVLQTRETALAKLKWELVFPGEESKRRKKGQKTPRGNRQRKFIEKTLRAHPDFRRLIAHLTGAAYYGYAVAETLWEVDNGRLVPAHFVCHSPRRFGFRQKDGAFVWRDQGMSIDGVDFREQFPNKFICSQPRINGDVPCREGLVRVLMWYALFRNWAWADWLKLAEMAWKPWRVGKYLKAASDRDIAALEAALGQLTASGTASLPETVELLLKWPEGGVGQGNGGSHGDIIETAGREMSKATLGQTLTTEQGKNGARALGDVHNEVRKDILEADAQHIAEVITRDLIEPMIRLNFGPATPVPKFRFITEDAADMVAFATALSKLAPILRMPSEWARDQLGIPHPEDEDELVGVDVDVSELDDGEADPANDDGDDPDQADDADKAA